MAKLFEMLQTRATLTESIRALMDKYPDTEMSAEDKGAMSKMEAAFDKIDKQIVAEQKQLDRERAIGEKAPAAAVDPKKAELRAAFNSYLAQGTPQAFQVYAALQQGNPTQAGYLIAPEEFRDEHWAEPSAFGGRPRRNTKGSIRLDDAEFRAHLLELIQRELQILARVGGGHDRADARLAARNGWKTEPLREHAFVEQAVRQLHRERRFTGDHRRDRAFAQTGVEPELGQTFLEEPGVVPQSIDQLRLFEEHVHSGAARGGRCAASLANR
jgi:hypothetical protein